MKYLDYVVAGGDSGRLFFWDRNAIDQWNPHSKKMATSPKINPPHLNQVQNECFIKQVMVNPGTVLILPNNKCCTTCFNIYARYHINCIIPVSYTV